MFSGSVLLLTWIVIAFFLGIIVWIGDRQEIKKEGGFLRHMFKGIGDTDSAPLFLMNMTILPFTATYITGLAAWKLVKLPVTLVQGVFPMKRKLISYLLVAALGYTSPDLWSRGVTWWNAPPPPPSQEAVKLIKSLEQSDGWATDGMASPANCPRVKRGDLKIVIRSWHADIYAGDIEINSSFSFAESRAINKAAEVCLRKLAAQSMDTVTAKAE